MRKEEIAYQMVNELKRQEREEGLELFCTILKELGIRSIRDANEAAQCIRCRDTMGVMLDQVLKLKNQIRH